MQNMQEVQELAEYRHVFSSGPNDMRQLDWLSHSLSLDDPKVNEVTRKGAYLLPTTVGILDALQVS